MSSSLPLVRALLGADAAFALCWLDDESATVEQADPPLNVALPIASLARAEADAHGVVFEAERPRRLVSSGLAALFPEQPAAAWLAVANPVDGHPPRGAFLLLWKKAPAVAPSVDAQMVRAAVADFFRPDAHALANRRLAARLAAVMAVIPQATVFIDDASGTALLNRSAAALLGVHEGDVPSGAIAAAMTRLREEASNRAEIEARAELLRGDGAARIDNWLWSFESPARRDLRVGTYPIGEHALTGRLWVFDDVTNERAAERLLSQRYDELEALYGELEAMNDALEQARDDAHGASQAKSAFLNQMSHELRTPLNAIIGFTNVLLRTHKAQAGDAKSGLYLTRIRENGTHLLTLLNDLLDLAKIEAGKLEIESAPVDLAQLVRETVAQLDGEGRRPGVELSAEVPEGMTMLSTDARKLRQVLINLIGNALKFTEKGYVSAIVHANGAGEPVSIEVRDTGIGIAPERQAAVFDAFEQADRDTAARFGGTGLGLAISRQLTEALGYRLRVDSAVGLGTTFTIDLRPTA